MVFPILITPLYLPVVCILKACREPVNLAGFSTSLLPRVIEKLSASFIASLSALFVYLALKELCERRAALWLTSYTRLVRTPGPSAAKPFDNMASVNSASA